MIFCAGGIRGENYTLETRVTDNGLVSNRIFVKKILLKSVYFRFFVSLSRHGGISFALFRSTKAKDILIWQVPGPLGSATSLARSYLLLKIFIVHL
jgi:hypothetical protein